jgi:hypothetical protein
MRRGIGVIGAIALVANTWTGAASQQASEAALIANERALYGALAKGDAERFRTLILPSGVWATPTGFVPMDRLAGGLEGFAVPQWGIENPHVVWTEGNSALVLYIRTGGGLFGDRPFAPMTLASTLWTKRGGKWLAVYHQESDDFP